MIPLITDGCNVRDEIFFLSYHGTALGVNPKWVFLSRFFFLIKFIKNLSLNVMDIGLVVCLGKERSFWRYSLSRHYLQEKDSELLTHPVRVLRLSS